MFESADLPSLSRSRPVPLLVASRTAFALGARGLLERPMVVVTGAGIPGPDSHRLAVRAAGLLARAGLVVGAAVDHRFGREVLAAAVRAGAPILGMLHRAFPRDFVPPVEAPAGSALWLSIFGEGGWRREGPDAADRLLGALAAAVLVIDDRGLPDALYIAEMALSRRRPVLFYGRAGAFWPGPLDRPGVSLRCTVPAMVRALSHLRPPGPAAGA